VLDLLMRDRKKIGGKEQNHGQIGARDEELKTEPKPGEKTQQQR
jgi:hypothetical protein